jgi:DNA-binding FadR family transcriptional regulator
MMYALGQQLGDELRTKMELQRVKVPKASDVLAQELRQRIRSNALRVGDVLPTERELAEQTGLSRASVREALRILEVEGLMEIRTGRTGGARVRRPGNDDFGRHLDLFIWGRDVSFEQLHEVRETLEAFAAGCAARRRTESDIAMLNAKTEAVEAALDDHPRYLAANLEWHLAVARASHNDLLIGMMSTLSNAIHEATAIEAFNSHEVLEATVKIHRRILAAIVAGDVDAARRRMARHVAAAGKLALTTSGT